MQITEIKPPQYPHLLRQIRRPPKHLYLAGTLPPEHYKYLCVIGARQHSAYGKNVCEQLIQGLTGYPIVIVSGLALGIDSLAHKAALAAKLPTIAFPGSGLDDTALYPQSHLKLAHEIVASGGALLSPFAPTLEGIHWTFPVRNKLMAAVSHAIVIIEGKPGSGTLLTAQDALEFNRDVLIVPGSIFSELSYGPHLLMRDGARPITNSTELLNALGFETKDLPINTNVLAPTRPGTAFASAYYELPPDEKQLIDYLTMPVNRDDLLRALELNTAHANSLISNLELKGLLTERDGVLHVTRD